uniref:hypothetical protein n=1 Tax=Alistipes sp. TaxID=1872444 RepID=UPI0040562B24
MEGFVCNNIVIMLKKGHGRVSAEEEKGAKRWRLEQKKRGQSGAKRIVFGESEKKL